MPPAPTAPPSTAAGVRGPVVGTLGIARRLYLSWLAPASLLLGLVLRTREWLFDKSLWLDEITLTVQLESRTFGGLTRPLGGDQGGPLGWLWTEKASIQLFGVHELALRAPAWLASLVALGVFPVVARRLIGPIATPAATLLVATSPVLIYYAAETKQYSGDTACALLAILATTLLLDSPRSWRSAGLWGLASALLGWFSQPTILVVAAGAVVLVLRWARNPAALARLAVGMLIVGGSLGGEYLLTLRELAANQTLEAYWQKIGGYPPAGAALPGQLHWMTTAAGNFGRFAQFTLSAAVLGLAVWGLATIARRHRWRAALVVLVVLAAVAAAVTKHYPLAQRLAVYLLPLLILLLCAGLADAPGTGARPLPRRWGRLTATVVAIALVVCTLPATAAGVAKLWRPDETTAGRQALQFVADHQVASDAVLIDQWGTTIAGFYGPRLGVRVTGLIAMQPSGGAPCAANPLAQLAAGHQRVWLVLLHHPSNAPPDRDAVYASQFDARATRLLSYAGPGDTAAYLFDLRRRPVLPAAPLASWLPAGCLTVG